MDEYEIRATYDERTIVVYQAYRPEIALPALQNNRFVPPFSLNRMTWIKPSFLWMMHRSGWASAPGQEHVLAVRITRAGWEEALANAVLTSPHAAIYGDADEWRRQLDVALVRVQWDPERTLDGQHPTRRAIQLGLSRHIVARYVKDWTIEIRDMTPLVHKTHALLQDGEREQTHTLLPRERVYLVSDEVRHQLGMRSS